MSHRLHLVRFARHRIPRDGGRPVRARHLRDHEVDRRIQSIVFAVGVFIFDRGDRKRQELAGIDVSVAISAGPCAASAATVGGSVGRGCDVNRALGTLPNSAARSMVPSI